MGRSTTVMVGVAVAVGLVAVVLEFDGLLVKALAWKAFRALITCGNKADGSVIEYVGMGLTCSA